MRRRQRIASYAQHYRVQAEEFKNWRPALTPRKCERRWLLIASSHERLTKLAEASLPLSSEVLEECEPSPDSAPNLRIAQQSGKKASMRHRREEPVAQARRHVAEAEAHIARQEALIARLSGDERYAQLVAEANHILDTLEHTLRLAGEHLALEISEVCSKKLQQSARVPVNTSGSIRRVPVGISPIRYRPVGGLGCERLQRSGYLGADV